MDQQSTNNGIQQMCIKYSSKSNDYGCALFSSSSFVIVIDLQWHIILCKSFLFAIFIIQDWGVIFRERVKYCSFWSFITNVLYTLAKEPACVSGNEVQKLLEVDKFRLDTALNFMCASWYLYFSMIVCCNGRCIDVMWKM